MEIEKIIQMIKETPNDFELGEKLRHYYWENEEKAG
jgi:hypothetical protein